MSHATSAGEDGPRITAGMTCLCARTRATSQCMAPGDTALSTSSS